MLNLPRGAALRAGQPGRPTPDDPAHAGRPDAVVRATRAIAVSCLIALVALGLAWELWLAPTGRGTLALKVLPLLLPLIGLLRFRMFTYRWLSLMVWLYVTEGVVRATSDVGVSRWLALAEALLALLLFAACAMQVRWRLKHPRPTPGPP